MNVTSRFVVSPALCELSSDVVALSQDREDSGGGTGSYWNRPLPGLGGGSLCSTTEFDY